VHCALGPGYLESVFEEAPAIELQMRNIRFERQWRFDITYRGHGIGQGRLDFLVDGCLVVEIKAVDLIGSLHHAQVLSYLKATGHRLGLLINFNTPVLKAGIKRLAL
jgi:GxxExxY protein